MLDPQCVPWGESCDKASQALTNLPVGYAGFSQKSEVCMASSNISQSGRPVLQPVAVLDVETGRRPQATALHPRSKERSVWISCRLCLECVSQYVVPGLPKTNVLHGVEGITNSSVPNRLAASNQNHRGCS